MAEKSDVAAQLAQGRSAVDTIARYVWACKQLGYEHADLTMHPGQLADWYGTEDGMDLGALQRCGAALEGAGRSVRDALDVQDRQRAEIAAAWQGSGAAAARDFLRRHGDSAAAVAAAIHAAADAVATVLDGSDEPVGEAEVAGVLRAALRTLGGGRG